MKRLFYLILFLLLPLTVCSGIYYLAETPAGLKILVQSAKPFVPGKLTLDDIEGTLFTPITIHHVYYENDNVIVTIPQINFLWSFKPLLHGKVEVQQLHMPSLSIQLKASTQKNQAAFEWANLHYLRYFTLKELAIDHFDITSSTMEPINGQLDLQFINNQLQIETAQMNMARNHAELKGSLSKEWNITWNVTVPDLTALTPDVQGQFKVSGTLAGPFLKPTLTANLNGHGFAFTNGKIQHILGKLNFVFEPNARSSLNLTISGIHIKNYKLEQLQTALQASFAPNLLKGKLTYSGNLKANNSILIINGNTDLTTSAFSSELSLRANQFQIINTSEYQIKASPDLKIQFNSQALNIQGKIIIPQAKIKPKDFSTTATLPDEVVFAGQPTTTANTLLSILPNLQIQVSLGDNVFLHYHDFKSHLRGKISITKTGNNPETAIGELYTVDGTYKAYGKELTIQNGRLIYIGGLLTNPGLNIKATSEIQTAAAASLTSFSSTTTAYEGSITQMVGVQILGTLDNPIITLIATPTLSQEDILSYLMFGKSSQIVQSSGSSILGALSSVYMGNQGTSILDKSKQSLQSTLGLSELNVESVQSFDPNANSGAGGVSSNTSVVLGKKLAPNLYVHTSIGIFNQEPTINLRYLLSKHWSVQTEQSTIDTGGDVLYSIERD